MCTPSDPALHTSMTIYTCEVCGKMTNLGTKIETDDGLFFADQLPSGWWQVERYDSESDAMNKYACSITCTMEFVRKQKKDHDDRVNRRMQAEAATKANWHVKESIVDARYDFSGCDWQPGALTVAARILDRASK